MNTVQEQDILTAIRRVVSGDISLETFEDRFFADTWDSDSALIRNISAILAETSGNDADEIALSRLRSLLASANTTYVVSVELGATSVVTTGIPTFGAASAFVVDRRPASPTGTAADTKVIAGSHS